MATAMTMATTMVVTRMPRSAVSSRKLARVRRAPRQWVLRGVLAALATVAAGYCVTLSFAEVASRSNRALAYRLAPYDGRFGALLAASLSGPDASAADRARADVLARQALRQDPTAVSAATTLGLNAQIRQQAPAARRLFGYAERLSRRNYEAQLWAIEEAVVRGNIADALTHYDIALRTNLSRSADQLYPILAQAITEKDVRTGLVRTLRARPQWGESFINYVAGEGADPRSTGALFAGLRHGGIPLPEQASAAVIDRLLGGGFADEAWAFYVSIRRGADRQRARDPRFAANNAAPTLFDWTPVNDGGPSVSIQAAVTGGLVDFSAPASVSGPLLRQVQLLPPGNYRLTGHSVGIQQEAGSLPYWTLKCRGGERDLGRVGVPNSAQSNGNFAGVFTVPGNCPVQVLALIANPSDAVSGLSGQIDRVELSAVR